MKEKWKKLLCNERLGNQDYCDVTSEARSEFQRDFDRIIFSSAFRRLQDKTQVFPLSNSDYVRTRLTHSLETSSVGRSLGTLIGKKIIEKYSLEHSPFDFGAIVASACLAHDIGNPPFGHSGEDAIQSWFEENPSIFENIETNNKNDFLKFEGNAQGFRILTRLQSPDNKGGMQLTYAVLATYMKYPRISSIPENECTKYGTAAKKFGIFHSELELFCEVAEKTGLIKRKTGMWQRHPLAFLVEAADDICYHIIDFEDGCRLGLIPFDKAKERFLDCLDSEEREEKGKKTNDFKSEKEKIEYLRAHAINSLINEVANFFITKEEEICAGEFNDELVNHIAKKEALVEIKKYTKSNVYKNKSVLEIELAGFETLGGLLSLFSKTILDPKKARENKLLDFLPEQFRSVESEAFEEKLLKITDYVSGMTDTFAVSTYKKLKGIALPI